MSTRLLTPIQIRFALGVGLVLAVVLALLWLSGAFDTLRPWLIAQQRAAQGLLAGAVRQVRGGQPGALSALLTACFFYGVVHAAGPGHGKLVIGGYGVARRVPLGRLAGIALLASLAQATVAVALVGTGVVLLGWTRERLETVNDSVMQPLGTAAIAGVGLWLMMRGLRRLWRDVSHRPVPHDAHHHHTADCGHAHGPSLDDMAGLTTWRDVAALVTGIALRPCTGALFLLILTFAMGIGWAGVTGTFAMGLGTACVTVVVAALSVWAREGALDWLPHPALARVLPGIEVLAGAGVAILALSMLAQGL